MRISLNLTPGTTLQKIEVSTFMSLRYVPDVEIYVAALVTKIKRFEMDETPGQFLI